MSGINLLTETPAPLGVARRKLIPLRDGKAISPATAWRWTTKGLLCRNGEVVRLEIIYCGGLPHTTREAVARFCERLTNANQTPLPPAEAPAARSAATATKLAAAGLL